MPIGANLSVIAVGAILAFATHVHTPHVSVAAVGAVLMAVGAAGLWLRIASTMRQRALTAAGAVPVTEVLVHPPAREQRLIPNNEDGDGGY
jgi:hypothetical protein